MLWVCDSEGGEGPPSESCPEGEGYEQGDSTQSAGSGLAPWGLLGGSPGGSCSSSLAP